MNKNKKHLSLLATVFAFVFVIGAVYAAGNGFLTFTGIANLSVTEVTLEIVAATAEANDENGSSGTLTVAEDGQTATIAVDITEPGTELEFSFYVANKGTTDAQISTPITDDQSEGVLIIGGTYEDIATVNDGIILSEADSAEYTITVQWDDARGEDPGTYDFTIELPYAQYVEA